MDNQILFDSQLLCQGINLNKLVTYLSILVSLSLLPLYLDEIYYRHIQITTYLKPYESAYLKNRIASIFKDIEDYRKSQNDERKTRDNQTNSDIELNFNPLNTLTWLDDPITAFLNPITEFQLYTDRMHEQYVKYQNSNALTSGNGSLTTNKSSVSLLDIFLPVFIWQGLAVVGGIIGIVCYLHQTFDKDRFRENLQIIIPQRMVNVFSCQNDKVINKNKNQSNAGTTGSNNKSKNLQPTPSSQFLEQIINKSHSKSKSIRLSQQTNSSNTSAVNTRKNNKKKKKLSVHELVNFRVMCIHLFTILMLLVTEINVLEKLQEDLETKSLVKNQEVIQFLRCQNSSDLDRFLVKGIQLKRYYNINSYKKILLNDYTLEDQNQDETEADGNKILVVNIEDKEDQQPSINATELLTRISRETVENVNNNTVNLQSFLGNPSSVELFSMHASTKLISIDWLLIFAPLLLATPFLVMSIVWSFKYRHILEIESIIVLQSVQILFVALKLDKILNWQWIGVLAPTWILIILMLTCCVGIMCHFSLNYLKARYLNNFRLNQNQNDPNQNAAQQAQAFLLSDLLAHVSRPIQMLSCGLLTMIPIILFLIMLIVRLDNSELALPYIIIFAPLIVTALMLFLFNCCTVNHSKWWFGIKYDYCSFILLTFPKLRFFANITCYVPGPELDQFEEGNDNNLSQNNDNYITNQIHNDNDNIISNQYPTFLSNFLNRLRPRNKNCEAFDGIETGQQEIRDIDFLSPD